MAARLIALLLILIAFTPGCAPKLLTNVAGEQRRCTVENVTAAAPICTGNTCGALGAVALLLHLAAVASYQTCIEQARKEGYQ